MKRKGIIIIGVIVAVIIVIMATVGIVTFLVFRIAREVVPVVKEDLRAFRKYAPVEEVPGEAIDGDVAVEHLAEEVIPTAEAVHFSKLVPFLPEAPSGWLAEEPYGATMTYAGWSWSMADRHYTKPGTYAHATINIVDGAYQVVGPWLMWKGFFEYEDTYGYLKRTTFRGYPAWKEHRKPHDYTLHISIDDRFMVSIAVYESDRDTLFAFANKINYQGIAALK